MKTIPNMFQDRIEAGFMLAKRLEKYKNEPGIVLAIPRGGVPIAYIIARELGFPVELVLTKKIGHPHNKEYAIGATSLTDYFVIPQEGVSQQYIESEVEKVRQHLKNTYSKLMSHKEAEKLQGKTVIVIDDGAATGNTLLATMHLLRKSSPAKIIIAVPVASQSAVELLSKEADEVIALLIPPAFRSVGQFYKYFEPVSDEEVLQYMQQLHDLRKTG